MARHPFFNLPGFLKCPGIVRTGQSLLIGAAIVLGCRFLFGGYGTLAGIVIAFLVIVARHDSELGTCLPLAILMVLVLGVLVLLLVLLQIAH